MKYLPLDIAINLMEYWILILMTQYICSAHMNLRRRNVLLSSGISILGVFFLYWTAAPPGGHGHLLYTDDYSHAVA